MEYFELREDEQLAKDIEHASEICLEPIKCNWNDISQKESSKNSYNLRLNDLRFKLGFNHIELTNSRMEEQQSVFFLECSGSLKTLTIIFKFKISDTYINGKIRICSVLNPSLESCYKLHLTRLVIKSIVKLVIIEDNYQIDYILNEFADARMSFVYKKNDSAIPVYNNIQDKNIKHALVDYVVHNCTNHAVDMIKNTLKTTFGFIPVSVSLRGKLISAFKFRKYIDRITLSCNSLVDEVINSTNLLIEKKEANIPIPDVSIVLEFQDHGKKSLKAKKVTLNELNFLFRKRDVSILLENDLVLLYVPVDFPHLNINYKYFAVRYDHYERTINNIEEHYKTNGCYIIMSLQSIGHKIDLNLLEFRIKIFELLDSTCEKYIEKSIRSWIANTLEFKTATVIENTFEKYFRIVMQDKRFDVATFFKNAE